MMQRKILCCLGIVLFLAGCEQPIETGDNVGGKVAISLSLQREDSRTVGPARSDIDALITQAVRYELFGRELGSESPDSIRIGAFNQELTSDEDVLVEVGTWDFHLKAYKADATTPFLQGFLTGQAVSTSGDGKLTFSLYPIPSGNGGIDITITLPPAYGLLITTVEAAFVDTEKDVGAAEITGDTVSFKKEGIAAGYYLISFKLKDASDVIRATVTEMVQVVEGLTSSKTIVLEARDFSSVIVGTTLAEKLAWLKANALTGNSYTITVNEDEDLAAQDLIYTGQTNITITLTGDETMRTISRAFNNSLFTINGGLTLILGKNITLKGKITTNSSPMITIEKDGLLLMYEGSKITGNTGGSNGGGVHVKSGGTFTMSGGEISNNTVTGSGGGVNVDGGTFTMTGGEISGNTTSSGGAGVRLASSSTSVFTMTGGKISNNTANYYGGGVFADNSSKFTMRGGEISGNKATGSNGNGGGVYVSSGSATNGASFTMYNGKISGNIAESSSGSTMRGGGGVCIGGSSNYPAVFTMYNGEISGNTAAAMGGGVSVIGGRSFIMHNGTISGNTAGTDGGGVYNAGTFQIVNNMVIYGSDAAEGLKNTATNDGAALFNSGTAEYGILLADGSFSQIDVLTTTNDTVKLVDGDLE